MSLHSSNVSSSVGSIPHLYDSHNISAQSSTHSSLGNSSKISSCASSVFRDNPYPSLPRGTLSSHSTKSLNFSEIDSLLNDDDSDDDSVEGKGNPKIKLKNPSDRSSTDSMSEIDNEEIEDEESMSKMDKVKSFLGKMLGKLDLGTIGKVALVAGFALGAGIGIGIIIGCILTAPMTGGLPLMIMIGAGALAMTSGGCAVVFAVSDVFGSDKPEEPSEDEKKPEDQVGQNPSITIKNNPNKKVDPELDSRIADDDSRTSEEDRTSRLANIWKEKDRLNNKITDLEKENRRFNKTNKKSTTSDTDRTKNLRKIKENKRKIQELKQQIEKLNRNIESLSDDASSEKDYVTAESFPQNHDFHSTNDDGFNRVENDSLTFDSMLGVEDNLNYIKEKMDATHHEILIREGTIRDLKYCLDAYHSREDQDPVTLKNVNDLIAKYEQERQDLIDEYITYYLESQESKDNLTNPLNLINFNKIDKSNYINITNDLIKYGHKIAHLINSLNSSPSEDSSISAQRTNYIYKSYLADIQRVILLNKFDPNLKGTFDRQIEYELLRSLNLLEEDTTLPPAYREGFKQEYLAFLHEFKNPG